MSSLYSIGYGKFDWPEAFLDGLIDCDIEMTHAMETDLKLCDGIKTGAVQIVIRLQPKCKEYE